MKTINKGGFSLIELLVALSILAVVAAIIVPRFLNVRSSAAQTSAQAQKQALQNAAQQWISLGGTANGVASDWLTLLGTNAAGGPRTFGATGAQMVDSSGNFGSTTISLQTITPVAAALAAAAPQTTISAATQGFYYTASGAAASGGALAQYSDGAGDAWTITFTNATGAVTFTPMTNSVSQVTL